MFDDIKLNARGRAVVRGLRALGTALVLIFFIISGWAFMALLVTAP